MNQVNAFKLTLAMTLHCLLTLWLCSQWQNLAHYADYDALRQVFSGCRYSVFLYSVAFPLLYLMYRGADHPLYEGARFGLIMGLVSALVMSVNLMSVIGSVPPEFLRHMLPLHVVIDILRSVLLAVMIGFLFGRARSGAAAERAANPIGGAI